MRLKVVSCALFLIGLLISGCRSDRGIEVKNISSETIHFNGEDSLLFKFPMRIKIFDSLAIVQTRNDEMLQIFKYPEFDYLTSVGRMGRGAGEVLEIVDFEVLGDTLSLIEMSSKAVYGYCLRDIFDSKKEPSSIRRYDALRDPLLTCGFDGDYIVSVYASPDTRFSKMSRKDAVSLDSSYGLPKDNSGVSERVPPEYLPTLWQSVMSYDADSGIAVSATRLGDVIEIFDVSDLSRTVVVGDGGFPNVYKKGRYVSIGKIDGYFDIVIDDSKIYALYSGSDREKQAELSRNGIESPYGGDIVRVYGFDGTMLGEYHLDRPVCSICINSSASRIIAIDSNSENVFCSFNLK